MVFAIADNDELVVFKKRGVWCNGYAGAQTMTEHVIRRFSDGVQTVETCRFLPLYPPGIFSSYIDDSWDSFLRCEEHKLTKSSVSSPSMTERARETLVGVPR